MKTALTIAGSDCSGGAGIQADLKTFAAHGVYGMSVIVSVVAENTLRVMDRQDISAAMIEKQLDAVLEDIGADAVKIGMLPQADCMKAVARKVREYRPRNVVVDPVMISKSGVPLMEPSAVGELTDKIFPLAALLTPNIPEAEVLTGKTIGSLDEMKRAARQIAGMGPKAVLIKGGHSAGSPTDVLFDGVEFTLFCGERILTKNTHGTGCTYSSAIASGLALGLPLREAVGRAKDYVTTAIRHALPLGGGWGPTNHFYDLYQHGLKGAKYNEQQYPDEGGQKWNCHKAARSGREGRGHFGAGTDGACRGGDDSDSG